MLKLKKYGSLEDVFEKNLRASRVVLLKVIVSLDFIELSSL
jgi:hypothetical protein